MFFTYDFLISISKHTQVDLVISYLRNFQVDVDYKSSVLIKMMKIFNESINSKTDVKNWPGVSIEIDIDQFSNYFSKDDWLCEERSFSVKCDSI